MITGSEKYEGILQCQESAVNNVNKNKYWVLYLGNVLRQLRHCREVENTKHFFTGPQESKLEQSLDLKHTLQGAQFIHLSLHNWNF